MNDAELASVARDTESEQVERKESLANKDKVAQAICAFANDLPDRKSPGYVLIGVKDKGHPAGLEITDELLLTIAAISSSGQVSPFPVMSVERRELDGVPIALATVEPSDSTPLRYNGRVYVRSGPSTRQASQEEERRLTEKRRAGDLSFDARPLPSASMGDLDIDLFRTEYLPGAVAPDVIEQNHRSIEEQLSSVRFTTPDGVPTAAGVVVVGSNPAAFVPGAFVQFLRLDGLHLEDPIMDEKEISGPLPLQLRTIDEILRANIATSVDVVSNDREVAAPNYPIAALQQYIRNALMHRSYEGTAAPVRITWFRDRVEVQNPGGPYGQVTIENFGTSGITDYRNPTIAEAMKALGYVQRFGVGISVAREALQRNGNPVPELEPHAENVLITVRARA